MISNPCNWFINGDETESFTYEGGTKLYHFSPYDNGLSSSMECNIIFLANDEKHALDVLKRMLKFRLAIDEKYKSSCGNPGDANEYLKAIEAGLAKVSLAPVNQFYRVGWAENDTILYLDIH